MKMFNPEEIIVGFLKAFFSQEKLYRGIENEFVYTDNTEPNSLKINLAANFQDEIPKSIPAIVVTEGGFSEDIRVMDNRNDFDMFSGGHQRQRVSFWHPLHIHCLARNKGPAKILQAATAQAVISFRKALYEFGIDNIGAIQGMPPQMLDGQQDTAPGMYDCAISMQIRMEQLWILEPIGDLEEVVRLSFIASLDGVEYDNEGNIITPSSEWFRQNIKLEHNEE